ncbi:unnamed protein product [Mytilus coruscus]|uniref:B box-type domain-containing protein n=1 Tax=Mytilus coruscus TaxID=42192 RepID=A0A6J8ED59_MYTCO|nr:unnamed protein product [Mytilus coruscus]
MASSKSIQRAQIHLKFKKAKDHKIITGRHGDDSGQILDFSDISCKDHSGQVCCLFCKTCDCLVCPTGVTKTHKTHELVEIEKAFRMRMEVLKNRKEKLEKQHADLIKKKEILNALKEANKLSIGQTQKDILKQKQIWKETAEQCAEELGSEINKQWKLKEAAIKTESSKVKHFEEHLTDKLQLIEYMNISMDVTKFFEDTKSFDDVKEMPNINLNHSQLTSFVPGQIHQSIFGSIPNEIHKDKIIRIKAIKEYTTELSLVANIIQCSENTFWIHDPLNPNIIQKVTLRPDITIKVLSRINEYAYLTALTRNGHLLISDLTSYLKILIGNENELITSTYNVMPFILKPIHINRENQLIVGAIKKFPIDYSVPGGGLVIVMDMDGNHQAMYEFDRNHEPLFKNPIHITTTNNGNIFIIDRITEDHIRRIVILEKEQEYLYRPS